MGRNGAEWVSQTVKHSRHKRILKRPSSGAGSFRSPESARKRQIKIFIPLPGNRPLLALRGNEMNLQVNILRDLLLFLEEKEIFRFANPYPRRFW